MSENNRAWLPGPWLLHVDVYGDPVGQPRHRSTRDGRHYIRSKHPVRKWRQLIEDACREQWGSKPPLSGAIEVDMDFFFALPKDKKLREKRSGTPHTLKPDKDNLEKAVLDSLVRAGVIADDKNVFYGRTRKMWRADSGGSLIGFVPGLILTIRQWELVDDWRSSWRRS
ncbi:MAG: RusA family crossover junction endodeoxyribonuclease [Caulobacteraceae bacterium]|nr:RusA family crossover junction endodeoxyribonuclease [Caulobacteraceae bacterium]